MPLIPLGIVVGNSFAMDSKVMKNLYIGAGVALVGFSLWHHLLYQPSKTDSQKESEEKMDEA